MQPTIPSLGSATNDVPPETAPLLRITAGDILRNQQVRIPARDDSSADAKRTSAYWQQTVGRFDQVFRLQPSGPDESIQDYVDRNAEELLRAVDEASQADPANVDRDVLVLANWELQIAQLRLVNYYNATKIDLPNHGISKSSPAQQNLATLFERLTTIPDAEFGRYPIAVQIQLRHTMQAVSLTAEILEEARALQSELIARYPELPLDAFPLLTSPVPMPAPDTP